MQAVNVRQQNGIVILTIDNPPVNATSHGVRAGLCSNLDQYANDPNALAFVLIGAGKTFIAGADIREFGKPAEPPSFHDLLARLDAIGKPVIAALHGTALGGGLEIALACHYRVGLGSVKLGLPEINLGLLPGAGGTQRLPRLVGPEKALDMILSGRPIGASEASKLGILDLVIEGQSQLDLEAGAVAFALAKLAGVSGKSLLPKVSERQDKLQGFDPALFETTRKKNARKWYGQLAPFKIVDCVQAACTLNFAEGRAFEIAAFGELRNSPQSKALRYAFFAEREAAKIPGLPADLSHRTIKSAAVIGAGTMGGGIAMCFANAGIAVKLLETSQAALDKGVERIRGNYATSVSRGSMSTARMEQALALMTPTVVYEDIAQADIVVEAVFEDMKVKHEVFGRLDQVMKPGAILATNTSTLNIDQIAEVTSRPQDVVGTHFFSPANVMKLQENVRGSKTSPEVIASVMGLAKTLGKVAVLSGNCDGFIGNRILAVYGRECDFLLEEGATPWQIDRALQGFGFPMGLYLMRDMAGLDVGWRIRQYREQFRDKTLRYSPIADRICEQGRFGQKTGAGYYVYAGREATPDPAVESLITNVSAELGIQRRVIEDADIVTRVLSAMANEGAKIVGEGIAIRASDIDVTYLNGYGFPRHQGGPMYWAETQGLDHVLATVREQFAAQGALWSPAPLLESLVAGEKKGWAA